MTKRLGPFLITVRRALSFVWQSSPRLAVASIIVRVLQGLLPLVVLYLTKLLIDAVTEGLKTPADEPSVTPILTILAGLAGIAGISAMLGVAAGLISKIQAQVVTDHMYALLQAKSVEVDLEYYENAQYQDTLHHAQQEAPYRPTEILNALLQLGQNTISLLSMGAILWWLHWGIIPVLVATAAPYSLVRLQQSNLLYAWKRERIPLERKAWYVNTLLTQATAAKEIRLFDLGPRLQAWFQDARSVLRQERISLERRWAIKGLVTQLIGVAGVFGICSFVAVRTFYGLLTVGDLVICFQAVQRASGFLEGFGQSVANLYESNLFLTTLGEFLGIPSRLSTPANPKSFPRSITQGVVFDHVSFQYPHEERVAIREFTFSIKPGEHVAFVGANGAGKTTLVKLLCRLYDPSEGRILIDGTDVRDYPITEVRGAVSGIYQDFVKFQLSARENIALGVRAHDVEHATVAQAANQAGIHEVIERLPEGYETLLGKLFDGGHELSIGEWQKVALARALLRDSQILVLDEPTSAMDAKAEAELFERFHELARGRMAILISHRLSTVKMADRIFVVDQGQIVEQGTHDTLMRQQGLYASLFLTQAQHYQ
ncbi:MAG: ABC transporter ATP-binding protein/permease [Nitrospira sp.]|nr:ABC transporter ATP-binding protein/permease [Nitrospira sp.]MDH4371713.1 ABC transporter ATP-binding protein/permease [Nitrospira sp.]MDH5348232.1 ABC transporter ATP-binding protein/permease [Nitrospira sp.]MDH5499151.1 ABC transporter ATP-binding protein/permease [Nitrospira sp.]MDH5725293.1 ABC transporter ATP-binding protein/permease [Nitrospira sp.]